MIKKITILISSLLLLLSGNTPEIPSSKNTIVGAHSASAKVKEATTKKKKEISPLRIFLTDLEPLEDSDLTLRESAFFGPIDDCGTYFSTSGGVIDDELPPVEDTIVVIGTNQVVKDMDVVVKLDHTFVGDLNIFLTGPSGDVITLMRDECGGNNNLEVRFDDDGAALSCSEPVEGTYTPKEGLSALLGTPFDGTWKLTVEDEAGGDEGVLISWCLIPTLATNCSIAPVPTATGLNCTMPEGAISLNETSGNANIQAWQWSTNGTAVFSDPNIQDPTATGAFSGEVITVTITETGGCVGKASVVVTVEDTTPPTMVCENTTINIDPETGIAKLPTYLVTQESSVIYGLTRNGNAFDKYTYDPETRAVANATYTAPFSYDRGYSVDIDPTTGVVYMIGDLSGSSRNLYRINLEGGTATPVLINGNLRTDTRLTRAQDMAFDASGNLYIKFQGAGLFLYDFATNTASEAIANVPDLGGTGLTYDYDNERFIMATGTNPITLSAIDRSTGVTSDLFNFFIPNFDRSNDATGHGIEYIGNDEVLISSTYAWNIIYWANLATQETKMINNSLLDDYKDLLFIPNYATDACDFNVNVSLEKSTFTYSDLGTNSITVTATDFKGNSTSCSPNPTVTVTAIPDPPVSSGDIFECAFNLVQTLNANDAITVQAGTSIKWYTVPTGGTEITGAPILSSVGAINYYAEAVDNVSGSPSTTRTAVLLTISDLTPPNAVTPANITICPGGFVSLTETGDEATTWSWSSDGSAIFNNPSIQDPIATGVTDGEVFTVTITNADGCSNTSTTTVTLEDNTAPTITPQNTTVAIDPMSGEATISVFDVVDESSVLYAIESLKTGNDIYKFDYDTQTQTLDYDGSFTRSTNNEVGYGFDVDPSTGSGYLVASISEGDPRNLYSFYVEGLNSTPILIASPVSVGGSSNIQDLTFDKDGVLYMVFNGGEINTVNTSTGATTAFISGLPSSGGTGITYDFDNHRLLYVTDDSATMLYEIDIATSQASLLFNFSHPNGTGYAQAIEYIGNNKVIVENANTSQDRFYTVDLVSEQVEVVLDPTGVGGNIKDLLFLPKLAVDACDPWVTVTVAPNTFTAIGDQSATITATDANGNISTANAMVTVNACNTPILFALECVEETQVSFSWEFSDPGSGEIEIGAPGFTEGTGTLTTGLSSGDAITGLTADRDYEAYIRLNCGAGGVSAFVGPIAFSTIPLTTAVGYNWTQTLGGSSDDEGYGIAIDGCDNVYSTGHYRNFVDLDPSANVYNLISRGSTDVFVQKFDANGDFRWAISLGGSSNDLSYTIVTDGSDNIYLTGSFQNDLYYTDPRDRTETQLFSSAGSSDTFIVKLTSKGKLTWAKRMGGSSSDVPSDITLDITGNIYVTGYSNSTGGTYDNTALNFTNAGGRDTYILKIDVNGDLVWAKTMGGSGNDQGQGIAVDSTGNIALTGYFDGTDASFDSTTLASNGEDDFFVTRLDSNGNVLWAYSFGADERDVSFKIGLSSAGDIYTVGYFNDTVDFAPGPTVENISAFNTRFSDLFIQKLSPQGTLLWAKAIGGFGLDEAQGLHVEDNGQITLTGFFQRIVDFDPGPETFNLFSDSNGDVFVLQLSASGNFSAAYEFGASNVFDVGRDVTIDSRGIIISTGYYTNTVDFDPTTGMDSRRSNGGRDVFVHSYTPDCTVPAIDEQPADVISCVDNNALFKVGAKGSDLSYQWTKNGDDINGANSSELLLTDISATETGNYAVTVTGACGSSVSSNAATLTIEALGTATATNDGPACPGGSVTLNETGGAAVSWEWSSDGSASFDNNTLQSPTAFNVTDGEVFTVTIVDGNGCTNTTNTKVIAQDSSNPVLTCENTTINLDPSTGQAILTPFEVTVESSVIYALNPFSPSNGIYKYNYDRNANSLNIDATYGESTNIQTTYAFDLNPDTGKVYLIASPDGGDRSLYRMDLHIPNSAPQFVSSIISAGGNNKVQDMTFDRDGTLYMIFQGGEINTFDLNTNTTTAFATVPNDNGASGLTYDFDNDRLLHVTGDDSFPIKLYSVALPSGTVTELFEFNTALYPSEECAAQAIEYVGANKVIASSKYGCDLIFSLDLISQQTQVLLNPTGSSDILKDFLFVPNYATDDCDFDVGVTLSQTVFTAADAPSKLVTVTATDASGNSVDCQATVTISGVPDPPTSTGDIEACVEDPVQILNASTAIVPVANTTITWYNMDTGGNVVDSPTLNAVDTVTYYAKATNTTTGFSSTTRTAVTLTIHPLPTAIAENGGPYCPSGSSVTLNETGGEAVSWSWVSDGAATFDDGNTLQAPAVSGAVDGEIFTVTITDASGCVNTAATTVTLEDTQAPTLVCQNATIALDPSTNEVELLVSDVVSNTIGNDYIIDQTGTFAPIDISTGSTVVDFGNNFDDGVSAFVPIGFDFNFFENAYDQLRISSNGFITFNNSEDSGCCSGQGIPNISDPNNLVAFAWGDLCLVSSCGDGIARYATVGNAPSRKWVLEFNDVDHHPSGNEVTAQVHLFEGSNKIEIHTTTMPSDGGLHTMGIENGDGTIAYTVSGRNRADWSATNDYVAFISNNDRVPDNCDGTASVVLSGATLGTGNIFDGADIGDNMVTVTATDATGTTATCDVIVTVTGAVPEPPGSTGDIIQCAQDGLVLDARNAIETPLPGVSIVWYDEIVDGDTVTDPILDTVGEVTYYAEAVNGQGPSASRTAVLLRISEPQLTLVSNDADNTICQGDSITFTATGANTGENYVFIVNDIDQVIQAGDTYVTSTLPVGDPTVVSVSVTNGDGCTTTEDLNVVVNPNPTATLTTPDATTVCQGTVIDFEASGGDSYQFFLNSNSLGTNTTGNYMLDTTGITPGTPTVTVVVTNAEGCTDVSNGIALNISETPDPADVPIQRCSDDTNVDLNQFNFAVLNNGTGTVTWHDGDPSNGGTLIDTSSAVDLNNIRDLWARVTATNGGCAGDVDITTDIDPVPTPADAPFEICENETSTDLTAYNETVLNGGSGTVAWYDGNPDSGGIPIDPETSADLNNVTDLWAEMTSSNGQCNTPIDITVTINVLPTPTDPNISVCTDDKMTDLTTYDDTVRDGETGTVTWYTGEPGNGGTAIGDPTSVDLTTMALDIWAQVSLLGTGCIGNVDVTVTINPVPTPVDAPFTICDFQTSIDLTDYDNTVLDGETGTVTWYDGNPNDGGTLISDPMTVDITGPDFDAWALVTFAPDCTTILDITDNVIVCDLDVSINAFNSFLFEQQTISWTNNGFPMDYTVIIQRSKDGGAFTDWQTGLPIDGSFDYTFVLGDEGTYNYKVFPAQRTDAVDNINNVVVTKQTFTIDAVSPDTYLPGEEITISFTTNNGIGGGESINVDIYDVADDSYIAGPQGEMNDGTITYTIPFENAALLDKTLRFRLQWDAHTEIEGFSTDFTINEPAYTWITPLENESIFRGIPVTLSWTSAGFNAMPATSIEYRISGSGDTWSQIPSAENLPNDNGSFNWIPSFSIPLDSLDLKLEHTSGYLKIRKVIANEPSISITSPDTNDLLYGHDLSASWTSPGIPSTESVIISFSTDNVNYTPVATVLNTGTYTWEDYSIGPSENNTIRIAWEADPSIIDESSPFNVGTPTISFDTPVENEAYDPDEVVPLSWTSDGVSDEVKLSYKVDNGPFMDINTTEPNDPGATTSRNWTVPSSTPLGSAITLRLEWVSSTAPPVVYSDEVTIVIGDPQISWATEPPANVFEGNTYTVEWHFSGFDPTEEIEVEYQLQSGGPWVSILTSTTEAQADNFDWPVPYDTFDEDTYILRVRLVSNNTVFDVSDPFVLAPPTIDVQNPIDGSIHYLNNDLTINWTSTGLDGETVTIEYLNGILGGWTLIDTVNADDGSYNWPLPLSLTPRTDYQIRIRFNDGDFELKDQTAFFALETPNLTITNPIMDILWSLNQTRSVSWTSNGVPSAVNLNIEITKNLSDWFSIGSITNTGSYPWPLDQATIEGLIGTIPAEGTQVYLRITGIDANWTFITDTSDIFTIGTSLEGDTSDNPIIITSFDYTDAQSTVNFVPDYTGPQTNSRNDVYYRFTVPTCSDSFSFRIAGSTTGRMHLLDASFDRVNGATSPNIGGQCPSATCFTADDLTAGDTYYLVVQGNTDNFTYSLTINRSEHEVDLGDDLFVCNDQDIDLTSNIATADSLEWGIVGQDIILGTTNSISIPSSEPTYQDALDFGIYLDVTKNGCTKTDTISINDFMSDLVAFDPVLPTNNATDQNLPLTLQWEQAGNPGTTHYDISIWLNGAPEPGTPSYTGITELTFELPENSLTFGETYRWKVFASNACENRFSSEALFTLKELPDLTSTVVNIPSTATVGDNINIQWSVENIGAVATDGNWSDRFYLSTDTSFSNNDILIGSFTNLTSLGPGSSYTTSQVFTIPNDTPANTYYILLKPSDLQEFTTSNNLSASSTTIDIAGIPLPDLTITTINYDVPGDNILYQGDEVTINYTIKNIGTAEVTIPMFDVVYLNPATGDSIFLNDFRRFYLRNVGNGQETYYSILPEEEVNYSATVTLPGGYTGQITPMVHTDGFNAFLEEDETNNTADGASFILAEPLLPDLRPNSFIGLPSTVNDATIINIQWQLDNIGDTNPDNNSSWEDRLYLSVMPNFDPDEALLVGQNFYTLADESSLEPSESIVKTANVFVPEALPAGDYYVYLVENANEELLEPDYANNTIRSTNTISITDNPNPLNSLENDMYVNAIDLSPENDFLGYGVKNFLVDMTYGTLESGEDFAQDIHQNHDRTAWYKFTIASSRWVEVFLPVEQNSSNNLADVGITVFREPIGAGIPRASRPGEGTDLADFSPLTVFGSTANVCVESGTYYVRISVDGDTYNEGFPIFGYINYATASENSQTIYDYDRAIQAYKFGDISTTAKDVNFNTGCLSLDFLDELDPLPDGLTTDNAQTVWFTLRTPSYLDVLQFVLQANSGNTRASAKPIGLIIYEGDVTDVGFGNLTRVNDDLFTLRGDSNVDDIYWVNSVCGTQTDTTFSVSILFDRFDTDNYTLDVLTYGTQPSMLGSPKDPIDIGEIVPTATFPGILTEKDNVLGCNAKMVDNPCDQSLNFLAGDDYANGDVQGDDLSLWYTFEVSTAKFNADVALTIPGRSDGLGFGYGSSLRLYRGDVRNYCNSSGGNDILLLADVGATNASPDNRIDLSCLEPGTYSIQILAATSEDNFRFTELGRDTELDITLQEVNDTHVFNLETLSNIDLVNGDNPLVADTDPGPSSAAGYYVLTGDTLGCNATVLPDGFCPQTGITRAIYRQIKVDTPGILYLEPNLEDWPEHKIYRGRITSLPSSGNLGPANGLGEEIKPICDVGSAFVNNFGYCLDTGDYLLVYFGGDSRVGKTNAPILRFYDRGTADYTTPTTADHMGVITPDLNSSNSVQSGVGLVTCEVLTITPVGVNGDLPCESDKNKQFFHEFELSEAARIQIGFDRPIRLTGSFSIYQGYASENVNGLMQVPDSLSIDERSLCVRSWDSKDCSLLPAGKYTVVTYLGGSNSGDYDGTPNYNYPSIANPEHSITVSPLPILSDANYNRPSLAFDIGDSDYSLHPDTTLDYPRYDQVFNVPTDVVGCTSDKDVLTQMEFPAGFDRVSFYTFKTNNAESYISIPIRFTFESQPNGNAVGMQPVAVLYPFNAKNDPEKLDPLDAGYEAPLEECSGADCTGDNNRIEFCRLPADDYTLAVFYPEGEQFSGISWNTIFTVDFVGDPPLYDLPSQTYDFGVIPDDNVRHYGKVGDTHPVNSELEPSNDFFNCLTSALDQEPGGAYGPGCPSAQEGILERYVESVQAPPKNDFSYSLPSGLLYESRFTRKTLWYSFQITGGGTVTTSVYKRTNNLGYFPEDKSEDGIAVDISRPSQPFYEIYEYVPTDADRLAHPSIDDYTIEQIMDNGLLTYSDRMRVQDYERLKFVKNNTPPFASFCVPPYTTIDFIKDPCTESEKKRYFVIVDKNVGTSHMVQIEMAVRHDPEIGITPANDLSENAFVISSDNTNLEPLTSGTYTGDNSEIICATLTESFEQDINCGARTIWWKFESATSGKVQLSYIIGDTTQRFNDNTRSDGPSNEEMVLYRETNFGTSPVRTKVPISRISSDLGEACLNTGVYYVGLTGCFFTLDEVKPQITVITEPGDLCGQPVFVDVNALNQSFTGTVSVDCHSFGDDFGEFGLTNTACFFDGSTNSFPIELRSENKLKSTWFELSIGDVGGKADLAFELNTVGINDPNLVKFRLLYGDCDTGMSSGECNNTVNQYFTLDCMPDQTSYFIQVVTPYYITGQVSLTVTTSLSLNSCEPQDPFPIVADFVPSNQCLGEEIQFINNSTAGTAIDYLWDFGDGNTSTQFEPTYTYNSQPANPVTLTVSHLVLGTSGSKSLTLDLGNAPTGNITFDHTGYVSGDLVPYGVPITFDPNLSFVETSPPSQFVWDFGNGETYGDSYSQIPTITYDADDVGSKTVTVTVSNGGCDAVFTREITVLGETNTNVGLCVGSNVELTSNPLAISRVWSTGSTAESIIVTLPGTYTVTQTYPDNSVFEDTFVVSYYPIPELDLGPDILICVGEAVEIGPVIQADLNTYLWNNGITTAYQTITVPGTYTLVATTADGCTITDEIVVSPTDELTLDLEGSITLCEGETVTLDTGYDDTVYTHLWSTGATTSSIVVDATGIYLVTITSPQNCEISASVAVTEETTITVDVGPDMGICVGDTITIEANEVANATYLWNTGETTRSIEVSVPNTYSVTVTTPSCSGTDDIVITNYPQPNPVDTPITICSDIASIDLTTYDNTVLNGSMGTVAWYEGDPDLAGILIANPTDVDLTGIIDLWAQVTLDGTVCTASVNITTTINALPTISQNGSGTCSTDLTSYSLEVAVSDGTVTSTAGTVTDNGSNVWGISDVPSGTDITITVTDGNGCSDDLMVVATPCNCPPIDAPTSGGDQEGCDGTTLTATATTTSGLTIVWYDAAVSGNVVPDPSWSDVGSMTYHAEAVDQSTGCTSATRTPVTLTINALPTIVQSGTATCSTDLTSYSLEVAVSDGTVTSTAGTVTDNGSNVWGISDVPSGTDITITVTDGNGCSDDLMVVATPCNCPPIDAPTSGGDQEGCDGTTLTATATTTSGLTIVWYDAAVSGNVVPDPSWSDVGSMTYHAEAVDQSTGCTSAIRTPVTLTIGDFGDVAVSSPEDIFIGDGTQENLTGGTPQGGVYSGPGVADDGNGLTYSIDPVTAEVGTHVLTYSYSDAFGCIAIATAPFVVTGPASIDLAKEFVTEEFSPDGMEYTVIYKIVADNSGNSIGVYDIVDTITIQGEGITLLEATIEYDGNIDGTDGEITNPFQSGQPAVLLEILAPGASESWTVTAVFAIELSNITPSSCISNSVSGSPTEVNEINNATDCREIPIEDCELIIYNLFSPNGDGANETFTIDCIELYPNNHLEIYNRWGILVYQADGYLNQWDGTSIGRVTLNASERVPAGTYYYILDLGDGSDPRVGWVYVSSP